MIFLVFAQEKSWCSITFDVVVLLSASDKFKRSAKQKKKFGKPFSPCEAASVVILGYTKINWHWTTALVSISMETRWGRQAPSKVTDQVSGDIRRFTSKTYVCSLFLNIFFNDRNICTQIHACIYSIYWVKCCTLWLLLTTHSSNFDQERKALFIILFYPVAWGYHSNTEMFKGFFGLLSVNSIYPCSRKQNIFFFFYY